MASSPSKRAARVVSRLHRAMLEATAGRLGGRTIPNPSGFPLARLRGEGRAILLGVVGRRSGERRVTPLVAVPDRDGWLVAASFGGADAHPAWYLNLAAAGRADVTDRGSTTNVEPVDLSGVERDAAWERLAAAFDGYRRYAELTDREIPVIRLAPIGRRGSGEPAAPSS